MSMRDAEQEGLHFQGATARDWRPEEVEALKAKAKAIRKLGFKAKAVKSNKNEWGCGSYVLMVEPNYFEYENASRQLWKVLKEEETVAEIQRKADEDIAKFRKECAEIKAVCNKYGIDYSKSNC